ncbi:MAG: hypothetical protein ACRD3I_06915, partial [Terriglobales bacterium]
MGLRPASQVAGQKRPGAGGELQKVRRRIQLPVGGGKTSLFQQRGERGPQDLQENIPVRLA